MRNIQRRAVGSVSIQRRAGGLECCRLHGKAEVWSISLSLYLNFMSWRANEAISHFFGWVSFFLHSKDELEGGSVVSFSIHGRDGFRISESLSTDDLKARQVSLSSQRIAVEPMSLFLHWDELECGWKQAHYRGSESLSLDEVNGEPVSLFHHPSPDTIWGDSLQRRVSRKVS